MSALEGAACVGQGPLFESTTIADHVEAAALCHRCPAIAACRALLASELDEHSGFVGHGGGPTGTWAGDLIGGKKYSQQTKFDVWLDRRLGVSA